MCLVPKYPNRHIVVVSVLTGVSFARNRIQAIFSLVSRDSNPETDRERDQLKRIKLNFLLLFTLFFGPQIVTWPARFCIIFEKIIDFAHIVRYIYCFPLYVSIVITIWNTGTKCCFSKASFF